jgi:hypothetical protein
MAIVAIPLALRRAAASTMHPANPPTYRGRATGSPLRFDLAVQRGALWALSMGFLLTSSVILRSSRLCDGFRFSMGFSVPLANKAAVPASCFCR